MVVVETRLNNVLNRLKDSGVRITPQRHAILQYMMETTTHPTADEIYKALADRFPNMSVATVYNNLRVLKEHHIISELTFGDASSRFDANIEHPHYHVICRSCGKIVDFEYEPLSEIEKKASLETGFAIDAHRLEMYGVCADCRRRNFS